MTQQKVKFQLETSPKIAKIQASLLKDSKNNIDK